MAYFEEGFTPVRTGGQYVHSRAKLASMIALAYTIGDASVQLEGLPEWARNEVYDVVAKPGNGFPVVSKAQNLALVRVMMQDMLEDRFGLKVRRENRPGSVLSMDVATGGIKMKAVADAPESASAGEDVNMALDDVSGRLISRGCSMAVFAVFLTHWLKRPVVDKTGLTGFYAFDIRWDEPLGATGVPPSPGLGPGGLALLMSNVQRQLGLQLRDVKGSAEYWVIEQLKRPTPN
jgi:uncharacterized protein (TIGR03435 family)